MIYHYIIKRLLFLLPPEKAHYFSMYLIQKIFATSLGKYIITKLFNTKNDFLKKEKLGLNFENPIGLAAGFDKNGDYIEVLSALGFGFLELGTVTPLAQVGNPTPRLFRLPQDKALINRMGFNNKGVDYLVQKIKNLPNRSNIIIGGNIGKNKVTPNELAHEDYLVCFNKLHAFVDYFVVNVSSPNTPNLRELQEKDALLLILSTLQNTDLQKKNPKPILLKIAPDLLDSQLDEIATIVKETEIAGVIATNTTIIRDGLDIKKMEKIGPGGLSGMPLRMKSLRVVQYLRPRLADKIIVGVGGIENTNDLLEYEGCGADLFQLYTGFIYQGPFIVKKILRQLIKNKID
jgi:dihydroorotate dehydrogenase